MLVSACDSQATIRQEEIAQSEAAPQSEKEAQSDQGDVNDGTEIE
jgi:hypothetical protein